MDKRELYRRINRLVVILLSLFMLSSMIAFLTTGFKHDRWPASLGICLVAAAPFLVEKIFKIRFPNFIWTIFTIFYILSGIVGSVWVGWSWFPGYDKVIHALAVGYVGSIFGLMILSFFGDVRTMKPGIVLLFCFFFSVSLGAFWEIYEYFADKFLGQHAQGGSVLPDGSVVTFVDDTMQDFLANTVGGLAFLCQYLVHLFAKKNLFVDTFIDGFETMKTERKERLLKKV